MDDLIELTLDRVVKPRPPTLTSIPSLLSVFQNEWDAVALETYAVRQQLAQTRQELSTALYQHDAAVRVIARLTRERDDARDALSKVTVGPSGGARNGDGMQLDSPGLPTEILATVQATQEKFVDFRQEISPNVGAPTDSIVRLSKTRRKRPVPEAWATPEVIEAFRETDRPMAVHPGGQSLSIDSTGDLVLVGAGYGATGIYSLPQGQLMYTLHGGHGSVTDHLWWGTQPIVATTSGEVVIYQDASPMARFESHAGRVTAVALHPSGDLLASVGVDRSYVFYDLTRLQPISQISVDAGGWLDPSAPPPPPPHPQRVPREGSKRPVLIITAIGLTAAAFHPDGHLFAAGTSTGQIKIFDVRTGANAANFDTAGSIRSLSFSENGTWLASASDGQGRVTIWNLRTAAALRDLEIGGAVTSVRWDYTGQFLATAGPSGITVQAYSKSRKEWSEPLRRAVPSVAAEWGPNARSLVSIDGAGTATTLREVEQ